MLVRAEYAPTFGDDPYNFQWGPVYDDGCISDYSVIEHKGILYFLDYGAFKRFTGGKPVEISQKVRPYLEGINKAYKTKCVAGSVGNTYIWQYHTDQRRKIV